jgi:hypothetical protein
MTRTLPSPQPMHLPADPPRQSQSLFFYTALVTSITFPLKFTSSESGLLGALREQISFFEDRWQLFRNPMCQTLPGLGATHVVDQLKFLGLGIHADQCLEVRVI